MAASSAARRLFERDERPVERGDRRVEQTAGLGALPLEPADEARRASGSAMPPPATVSCASAMSPATFSARIIACAPLGERVLLARLGRKRCKLRRPRREGNRPLRSRRGDPLAKLGGACSCASRQAR